MGFNRNKAIIGFLKINEGQKFTSREIAEWLVKTYPEEIKQKAERSKNKELLDVVDPLEKDKIMLNILRREMTKSWFQSIQNQEPNITIEKDPRGRKYYYKKTDQAEIEDAGKEPNMKEKDIYLKLSEFLWNKLGIYIPLMNRNA